MINVTIHGSGMHTSCNVKFCNHSDAVLYIGREDAERGNLPGLSASVPEC